MATSDLSQELRTLLGKLRDFEDEFPLHVRRYHG